MVGTTRKKADEHEVDRRAAHRHKLVLRVGLIEQHDRSIFCLVKNISATGVQVKPYGRLCKEISVTLRVGDKASVSGKVLWLRDGHAGVEFGEPFDPQIFLRVESETVADRRRASPRVVTALEAILRTGGLKYVATVCDLSMGGARLRTERAVTFSGSTSITLPGLPTMVAYVRWIHGSEHGLTFPTPLPIQIIADLLSEGNAGQISNNCAVLESASSPSP